MKTEDTHMIPCIMAEEIKEIKKEIANMSNNVDAIKRALLGDEYNKEGLIIEFQSLKLRVKTLERKIWYASGFAAAVGAGVTIMLSILF